ncbi:DeoR/GlpR family DNA-binding transcription regulator [Halonatronum saccharophilum]|uniref:DeoR/GlpR family DNA-binding transcription regulator n=1 Tax=Halonatronum saccharophilum TaxID=150060 RepID=UPI0004859D12|nr:DeoR/GlpR family DNA-binding transcription regulator [Halonatronum saccharophilum]
MFAEERRRKIVELLNEEDSKGVNELCNYFEVSPSTIRRDLQVLEKEGLVKRTHGGAVPLEDGMRFEPSFIEKEKEFPQEKKAIGRKAAELVNNGETIILDAGTTTIQLAKALKDHKELTIITNATNIALELAQEEHQIILIGGTLKKTTLATVGPVSEMNLNTFYVDKVFLGANGIHPKAGITTPDLVEANTKRTMIERAESVIVLADNSKFGEISFVSISDLSKVDTIITNKGEGKSLVDQIKKEVKVIFA